MHHHDHSHAHSHGSSAVDDGSANISIAFFLNLFLSLIEATCGYLFHSMALLTDSLHDLGDALALALSWYLERVSQRKRDSFFSYGYKRFSLLAALISGAILSTGSILIIIHAISAMWNYQKLTPPVASGVFAVAVVGFVLNFWAYLRLSRGRGANEKMVSFHLLEDLLGQVVIMVMAVILNFFPQLSFLDPLLSVIFGLIILSNVYKHFKKNTLIFLQSVPEGPALDFIEACLLELDEVRGIHDFHLWSLDGRTHVVTLHAVIHRDFDPILVKKAIRQVLLIQGINHSTIELEEEGEICDMENCNT